MSTLALSATGRVHALDLNGSMHLVHSPAPRRRAGEPGVLPVASAVAHALLQAMGTRIRSPSIGTVRPELGGA